MRSNTWITRAWVTEAPVKSTSLRVAGVSCSDRGHHVPALTVGGVSGLTWHAQTRVLVDESGTDSRGEDRSKGVGIKEGVPASQSALLFGPEHSLSGAAIPCQVVTA